jgi:hypothetical protein
LAGQHDGYSFDGRGSISPTLRDGRKGILDLLLFPSIGRRLFSYVNLTNPLDVPSRFSVPIRALAILGDLLVGTELVIATHALAVVLTLALSPVILIVHFFASYKLSQLNKKINLTKATIVPRQVDSPKPLNALMNPAPNLKLSANQKRVALQKHLAELYEQLLT